MRSAMLVMLCRKLYYLGDDAKGPEEVRVYTFIMRARGSFFAASGSHAWLGAPARKAEEGVFDWIMRPSALLTSRPTSFCKSGTHIHRQSAHE